MCNVCGWLGWMLDIIHKLVTWGLGCVILLMLCLGFLVTLTAGVAYGYNYSIAEFMHVARLELQRYARHKAVNPNIGEHFWWDSRHNPLRSARKKLREGLNPLDPQSYAQNSDDNYNQFALEKSLSPFEISSLNTEPTTDIKITRESYEPKKMDWVEKNEDHKEVEMPSTITTHAASEVFLKDLFPSRTNKKDQPLIMKFDTQPKFDEKDIPDTTKIVDPYMFRNMKVMGEEDIKGPTMQEEENMKMLKPFMLQNREGPDFPVRTSPNVWNRQAEEGKKVKPFMLTNLKSGDTEVNTESKNKGVLPELPDYGEYGEEEAFKKPV